MMREPTIDDLAIDVRDTFRKSELLRKLTEDHGRALFDTMRRHLPELSEADTGAVLLLTYRFLAHVPDAIRRRARQQNDILSEYWMGQYVAAVVGAAGERLHTHAQLAATSTRRPAAAPAAVDHQAPADVPDHTELTAWLDRCQADVDHSHRFGAGVIHTCCSCDLPEPCEERADQLAAIEALRATLNEVEQLRNDLKTVIVERDNEREAAAGLQQLAQQAREIADSWSQTAQTLYANQHATPVKNDVRGLYKNCESIGAGAEGNQLISWAADIDQIEVRRSPRPGMVFAALGMTGLDPYGSTATCPQVRFMLTDEHARQLANGIYVILDGTATPDKLAVTVIRPADVPDEWLQAAFDAIGHSGTSDGDEQMADVLAAVAPLIARYAPRHQDDAVRAVGRAIDVIEALWNGDGQHGDAENILGELDKYFGDQIATLSLRDAKAGA